MAKKDEDISIQLADDDTISVNIEDNPDLQEAVTEPKTPKEPKEPKTKRVTLEEPVVSAGPTPEQALAEAQTYAKQQEEGRRAAEATANNERSMREQAQREAAQAQRESEQSKERATNSELAVIENGIAAAQRDLEAQEAEYTRAAEAGEFAKMASIQTKLSKAAAALDRLENAKATFDVNARQVPTEGRIEAPVVQTSAFDKYLSQFSPNAQNWMRQHPDCAPANVGGSQAKYNAMMKGHYAALEKNLSEGSTDYFKEIENHITPPAAVIPDPTVVSKASEVQAAVVEPKTPKHVQPSAPPSRDNTGGDAPRNMRDVRLNKDQQEMARVSFPHLPEAQAFGQYARNLIELEKEGKLGRTSH